MPKAADTSSSESSKRLLPGQLMGQLASRGVRDFGHIRLDELARTLAEGAGKH